MKKLRLTAKFLTRRTPDLPLVEPAPFPGKWPTKIAVQVRFQDAQGSLWQYIGKPNMGTIRFIRQLLDRRLVGDNASRVANHLWVYEFDRKHIVRISSTSWPGQEGWSQLPVTRQHNFLTRYYHPFEGVQPGMFTDYITTGMFSKRLKSQDKVLTVFSPKDKLKLSDDIHPHKVWLSKQWEQLKAQKPKVAPRGLNIANSALVDEWLNAVPGAGQRGRL